MKYRGPMCPGSTEIVRDEHNPNPIHHDDALYGVRPEGIKRIRIKCTKCKRRVMSSVSACHDGCCVRHKLPPHKPKGWWRHRNKKKRKRK
jgi:hypothetical protein